MSEHFVDFQVLVQYHGILRVGDKCKVVLGQLRTRNEIKIHISILCQCVTVYSLKKYVMNEY